MTGEEWVCAKCGKIVEPRPGRHKGWRHAYQQRWTGRPDHYAVPVRPVAS